MNGLGSFNPIQSVGKLQISDFAKSWNDQIDHLIAPAKLNAEQQFATFDGKPPVTRGIKLTM